MNSKAFLQWLLLGAGIVLISTAFHDKLPTTWVYERLKLGTPTAPRTDGTTGAADRGGRPVKLSEDSTTHNIASSDQYAGEAYAYDRNGNNIGLLPNVYRDHPSLYMPAVVNYG